MKATIYVFETELFNLSVYSYKYVQFDANLFTVVCLVFSKVALDKEMLKKMGITNVLNAAKGEKISQVNTNQLFYDDVGIRFYGCPLMDVQNCRIETYFDEATDFIDQALSANGKIFVHCFVGVSRSASFILGMNFRRHKLKYFFNKSY